MSRARPAVIAQVMHREVLTVPKTMPASEALRAMHREGLRHAVVVDERGAIAGVVSDRDLGGAQARVLTTWLVHDVMSAPVVVVSPDAPISEAARVFRARHVGCLPVVRAGVLVGIVTRSDLIALLERPPQRLDSPFRCRWPVLERRPRGTA